MSQHKLQRPADPMRRRREPHETPVGPRLASKHHRLEESEYSPPYVQTNKSDYLDAEAIAEAVQRPRMRFVPIKTEEQLDLQALYRVRERWVMRRTAVVNQIRSLLLRFSRNWRRGDPFQYFARHSP